MVKKGEEVALHRAELEKKRKLVDAEWSLAGDNKVSATAELVCTEEETDVYHSSLPGRRSFGGFHPFLEQHYREALASSRLDDKLLGKSKDAESSIINDEEMLARYDTLIGLPRGPNQVTT